MADVICLGEVLIDFVPTITGSDDPEAARDRLWGPKTELMTVTRGHRGCVVFTREHAGEVGAPEVEAIDTTGAGDAFVAGLLHGLLRHPAAIVDPARLHQICRFACAAGALTTTVRGAIPALPGAEQVAALLAEMQT